MHPLTPTPPRIPQRVLVVGTPGVALTSLCQRLAEALDLPLVEPTDLSGPEDLVRLAAFEGWVTPIADEAGRAALLPRADLLVNLVHEEAGLRGLVKRTVRRIRAEPGPDLAWLTDVPRIRPGLPLARLEPADAAAWVAALVPPAH
ncbi:hypothetical protein KG112_01625 [Nocardioides sp. zg-ZUI104]|uniref:hypothetical protein n=1 Tax=Nocardioides faecalis TaxID=2803858 RepID=UPI001BD16C6B|nr:hypothetical protein [Nocardioides faecalis]MBS4751505.1 hypothetical protein [Nocardioides faecalis]